MKRLYGILFCALAFASCSDPDDYYPHDPMRIGALIFEEADPILKTQMAELSSVFGLAQYLRIKTDADNGISGDLTPEQTLANYLPGATLRQEGNIWHIEKDGVETVVYTWGRSLFSEAETDVVWMYKIPGKKYVADKLPRIQKSGPSLSFTVTLPEQQQGADYVTGTFDCDVSVITPLDSYADKFIKYGFVSRIFDSAYVIAEDLKIWVGIGATPFEYIYPLSHFRYGPLMLDVYDGTNKDLVTVLYDFYETVVYYNDTYKIYYY